MQLLEEPCKVGPKYTKEPILPVYEIQRRAFVGIIYGKSSLFKRLVSTFFFKLIDLLTSCSISAIVVSVLRMIGLPISLGFLHQHTEVPSMAKTNPKVVSSSVVTARCCAARAMQVVEKNKTCQTVMNL